MERALHSAIPPVTSSILTYQSVRLLIGVWGSDRVAMISPHVFAVFMAATMVTLGSCTTSFGRDSNQENPSFIVKPNSAKIHSMLLLSVPGTMHFFMFRRRIFSSNTSIHELYDLILVWTLPYLLHCCIVILMAKSPYEMSNGLFPKSGQTTLQGSAIPLGVTLIASLAAQQRYLIPFCVEVSYQFNGHDIYSTWVVSMLLTCATLCAFFALLIWRRKSTVTDDLFFGEYHEDVVQLSICASGLFLGKALGMSWNLTPLPILAFLGLSVWLTNRMLRYLLIFLFVVHASGVVLFSYRFASINLKMSLPFAGLEVGLIRFGMFEVAASIMIGLVVGFAARPSGGIGADILKRLDVPGIVMLSYSLFLMILEVTLLKRSTPQEFVGKESILTTEENDFLYDHVTALMTSALTVGISIFLRRTKVISKKSNVVILSIAVGKALSIVVDAGEQDGKIRSEAKHLLLAQRLLYRSIVASLLVCVMMAPKVVLTPIHIKSSARYKRSLSDGKPVASIPAKAYWNIMLYSLVILPLAIIAAIPAVLTPLVMTLSSHYGGGAYYKISTPISEMFGFGLVLWGITSLSMLNHYFPDGGIENWKKVCALALVMGAGVALSAPTVPEWLGGDDEFGVSNPYASISSLGSRLVKRGHSRTGGWGILAASLATLLAITGPLELRERRHPSGRKDKQLLLRLMTFSLLFGAGTSWFITMQSMSQESTFILIVSTISCMVISFFGTVSCVLAYFLELENFDEVEQMTKVLFGAFWVFGVISALPSMLFSSQNAHAFGAGGWLSTYLSVSCLVTLALSSVLRLRPTKDQSSRGLGNLSCIIAFVFCMTILYGRFGVAGLDRDSVVTAVLGVPASVLGTLLISPVLLLLEGEAAQERRNRVSRLSTSTTNPTRPYTGINLPNLKPSNRIVPVLIGIVSVFFAATLYTILLRGSPFFGRSVAKSHIGVMSNVGRNVAKAHVGAIGRSVGKVMSKFLINKDDSLVMMAGKAVSQSQALIMSARLNGASIWTASNILGPILHLCGLIAAVPSIFLLISSMWSGINVPKAQVTAALPLNAIPLFFGKGIPALRAAALISVVGGLVQLLDVHKSGRRSQMRM